MLRAKKGHDDKILVATCTSANGKPPSVVSWETRLKGEAEYQEIRNPNGTVTVISRYRLVPSREAHQQSLACIVNYHMDRFRESITINVQCEWGQSAGGWASWCGHHCFCLLHLPCQSFLLLHFSSPVTLPPPFFPQPLYPSYSPLFSSSSLLPEMLCPPLLSSLSLLFTHLFSLCFSPHCFCTESS